MTLEEALSSELIPQVLRDALRVTPNNAPLLAHLAEILLQGGCSEAAETLFRQALIFQPNMPEAQLGLAGVFYRQGKFSASLVLVEELEKSPPVLPKVSLLHARLAIQAGDRPTAARFYTQAKSLEPSLADSALEQEIGNYLQRPAPPPVPSSTSFSIPDTPSAELSAWDFSANTEEPERLPAGDLPPDNPFADIERPSIAFADVGGMDPVKEEVRMKIILPLQQPDLFKAYGKKVGGGILMYGPPGCGKTFLARATAGEVNAGFLAVGISDILDMWIGQSERNLHAIFEQARAHRPCVLFFDEVDALGANRTDMLKSGGRQMINQFLSELDGVNSSNEGILILAATNTPWHLDPAFRRPGRFDRILFVPPPDQEARASILRIHLKGKPQGDIDFVGIARKTDGYSGADLKALIDAATEAKLREAMKSGKLQSLQTRDILDAMRQHRPTVRDWFETARNYALYSNQSGTYDDILNYLKIKK
ncbi:MAG: AAA family ATPase [Puniceicoccales bacterium]|jgi:AAA+ superfamily predicted ATPase|nr:AAA family ATPase [Puniceicoccales bacterium]